MEPFTSKVGFGTNSQTSIYPILSIDGGGIRGIIPATVLVEIETITKKPISQLFHLIGGTSTGGLGKNQYIKLKIFLIFIPTNTI